MTIEEKAKAYDEALEKAKIEINTKGIGETVNLCEQLFPELAESEDERIRKELKEAFEAYDIESTWNGIPIRSIFAWLEKQKESLHIPETCKENADSFTDGIIEVRSFQRGMEEGRRLERQKEQNGEDEFLEDELSAFLQNYDKEYDDDAAVSDVARHFYEIGKKQKEHKPQTDDEKEYVRTIKSIISDFIRDKKPENLAYYQRIYDWLDGRHVPFSCGHENGQQADPVFSKQEYESHPIISTDTTSAKPAECSKATINGQPIPTENHSVDIPLAEWSEEDGKTINDACCWIAEYAGYLMDKNYGKASMLMGLTDKLKSLRPQSQGIYQQVVKGIRDMCDRYEQNGMFTDERARDFLGNVRVKCKDAIECAPILDELAKEGEPVSKDLEEAAIDFADNARKQLYSKDYAISSIADYDHGCIDGFKAGAEWLRNKGHSFGCRGRLR